MREFTGTLNFSPNATTAVNGHTQLDSAENSPAISVVIPVFRSAAVLKVLHRRLSDALCALGQSYEIVFVEDGSNDASWSELANIAENDSDHVRAIKLSRNYGQQAAITAGLENSSGDWAVVMDCDLEDPPEFIAALFAKSQEGFDVVWARRASTKQSVARAFLSKAYFNLLSALTNAPIDNNTGSFTMISRPVINAFLRFSDHNRHYKLILLWLGFRQTYVDYDRPAREAEGKSAYTLASLVKVAMQGLFFQSTVFLEWIVSAGFLISFAGLVAAIAAVVEYFVCRTILPGWTSITVLLLLLGGANLIAIGTVGMYIGQIFEQVKGRPLFVVEEFVNCTRTENPKY